MRTVAYCRYSSDAQRDASLEDQARNILGYCKRVGWPEPRVFTDAAISGSRNDRPGYQAMLESGRRGEYDVLLVDDLSRLSRDQIETAKALRGLKHYGVRIIGVSDGIDTDRKGHKIEAGLRGLMSELYLEDLADKTHRGLMGQALKGLSAGGLPYGYRVVPGADGNTREIDPVQADIVRGIFAAYIAGQSPRTIAADLNKRGIPSPRGGTWGMNGIYPDKRGIGILGNPIYSGKVIWNRSHWVKDPETGNRLRQERPESEWVIHDIPTLRIVDAETWQAAQQRASRIRERTDKVQAIHGKRARSGPMNRYLLSGILVCGVCGGPMVSVNKYSYGCARQKDRGICENRMKVTRTVAETCLLESIKRDLLSEAAFNVFEAEARSMLKAHANQPDTTRQRLQEATRERDNIMQAIRAGIITPSTKKALEAAERAMEIAAEESAARQSFQPSQMLPRARETWRRMTAQLERLEDVPAARECIKALLGETIRVVPDGDHLTAEIPAACKIGLVAGAGFVTNLTGQVIRIPLVTGRA